MIRATLAVLALVQMAATSPTLHTPAELDHLTVSAPTATVAYGADPLQVGDLRLPAGAGPFPLAVVVHGGCWTKGFDTRAGVAGLADALTRRGVATWNVEYRQVGDAGGGYPGTFQDIGAAVDKVRDLARRYPLDLKQVVLVGHSAGAHGVLWAASRPNLPAKSPLRTADPFRPAGVVAIDGPQDLRVFYGMDEAVCGKPVFLPMFGGSPQQKPDAYSDVNPAEHLPLRTPQVLVASALVGPVTSARYQTAARAAGDSVEVVPLTAAGHFNMLYPSDPAELKVEAAVLALLSAAAHP